MKATKGKEGVRAHNSRGHLDEEVLEAVAEAAGYIVSTVQKQRKTRAGAWVTFFFIESKTPAHGMMSLILKKVLPTSLNLI